TNGAYRLHPIEWNIGESAGALAAYCVQSRTLPQQVHADEGLLRSYQSCLLDAGIPIYWWGDLAPEHPVFAAAQRLAMDGIWPGGNEVEFRPDNVITDEVKRQCGLAAGILLEWPSDKVTRGEAAIWLADKLYGGDITG